MGRVMGNPDDTSLIRIARESGDETAVEPLNLGQRVRDLRKARGWTLEQAAVQDSLEQLLQEELPLEPEDPPHSSYSGAQPPAVIWILSTSWAASGVL